MYKCKSILKAINVWNKVDIGKSETWNYLRSKIYWNAVPLYSQELSLSCTKTYLKITKVVIEMQSENRYSLKNRQNLPKIIFKEFTI